LENRKKKNVLEQIQELRWAMGLVNLLANGLSLDIIWITLWLFKIAMENGPFIDGLPIKNGDFPWLC